MNTSQVDVTYGVLNYNPNNNIKSHQFNIQCLESLYHNRDTSLSSDVYVIDQGSCDDIREELKGACFQFGFRFLSLEKNIGISRGINLIARLARSRFVSLVTSDTLFTPGLDVACIEDLEANPDIGQMCPLSNKSDLPHQQYIVDQEFGSTVHTNKVRLLKCIATELTIQFWPRDIFDIVGYFDERWKACYENMDFSLRIFLAKRDTVVNERTFCWHRHNLCTRDGSIDKTYDDYIDMPDGFSHNALRTMWNHKWPDVHWHTLYQVPPDNTYRSLLAEKFRDNIYLDYVQNVSY